MNKVLCTGVAGFIGQYLAEALKDKYEVFGLYQNKEHFSKNPSIVEKNKFIGDLRDKDTIEEIIQYIKPDFVIHLAAKTEVALSFDNYTEVSDVNYIGTVNLAEACRKYCDLKLFVMASTMETYGHQDPKNGAFTEDTPQNPKAPYAVAKLACEYYLRYMEYAYDFPYTILRQTNAYGRTDNDFFVIERIITQMLKGDNIRLGDPRPVRNFIWIDDLIKLYETLLEQPDIAKGEVFCVGPDNGLSIEDLVDEVGSILNWSGSITWHNRLDGLPDLPGEIFYLNSSNKKATKMLGWKPVTNLREGLEKTIELWKDK